MEKKKEYTKLLKSYVDNFYLTIKDKYKLTVRQYKSYCKQRSNNINLKDFKIEKNHSLDEYFDKYYRDFKKGRLLVFLHEELFLLNQKRKYWEIPNETDACYFEIPSKKRTVLLFLSVFLLAAGVAVGSTFLALHYLNPQPIPPIPGETVAEVEMDEESQTKYPGYSLSLEDTTAIIDNDFDSDIFLNSPTYFINDATPVLHARCESVTSNGEELSVDSYEYRITSEDRNQAHIHIPGEYIKGPVDIKIKLISSDYFCCRTTSSGDVFYEGDGLKLQNALDEVQDGETITILKSWDYADTEFIAPKYEGSPINYHITIDGNYQKLTATTTQGLTAFLHMVTDDIGSTETERHNCIVDMKNLDIETTGYYYSVGYDGGDDGYTSAYGTMTNCKISSDQVCLLISGNDYGESDVHLYDCEFTHRVDHGSQASYNSIIAPQFDGRVTIHSGTYTSTDTGFGVRVLNTGGIANIEGGTIKAGTALYALFERSYSTVHKYSDINAYHGTIIGDVTEGNGRDEERIQLRYDVVVEGNISPTVEDLRPN